MVQQNLLKGGIELTKDGSVRITFKQDEEELKYYINSKSSPAAYIKDLIKDDMGKSRKDVPKEPIVTNNFLDF